MGDVGTELRLAEVIAALSIATDVGMGNPLEFALCSCVLSMRLGESLGLDDDQLRMVYYEALLRYIGCNAETHVFSSLVGDEAAGRAAFATVDNGNPQEIVGWMVRLVRQANAGGGAVQVARNVARGLLSLPRIKSSFLQHCEVAQRLAGRLGFDGGIILALGQLYE